MKRVSGLPDAHSVPEPGSLLLVDRIERLLAIAKYFKDWKKKVESMPDLSKDAKQSMLITHWLFEDMTRTCHGMVGVIRANVPHSKRRWVPRRFNQDTVESLFGQLRNLAGSNTNMDMTSVDAGMHRMRTLGLKKTVTKYVYNPT